MSPLLSRMSNVGGGSPIGFKNKRLRMALSPTSLSIVGGTKYTYNGKVIHTFTSSDTLIIEGVNESQSIEYFIVGGGGNGSSTGGAGGGVVVTGTTTITDGTYTVTVGGSGQQSSFNGITASSGQSVTGSDGGNSGANTGAIGQTQNVCIQFWRNGSCRTWSTSFVGGGGAGSGSSATNANGGNGTQAPSTFRDPSNPYGTNDFYFGGGGAGGSSSGSSLATAGLGGGGIGSQNGVANTGGGGGGSDNGGASGSGGSGIIMIAYNAQTL